MNFKEYQEKAVSTAIYPESAKLTYPVLGLNGEAGEVAEKVKKIIRDNGGVVTPEKKEEIKKELGDVLWYLALTAYDLDLDLTEVAQENIEKLQSRKDRGKLTGNGDNR